MEHSHIQMPRVHSYSCLYAQLLHMAVECQCQTKTSVKSCLFISFMNGTYKNVEGKCCVHVCNLSVSNIIFVLILNVDPNLIK